MTARDRDHRIRVLTLARDAGSGYGGAEKLAFEFARRLDVQRFKAYLCTTRAPHHTRVASVARDRRQLESEGIEVLELNRRSHIDVAPFRLLYAMMKRESIDVLHAHMPRASAPGSVLARMAGVPVVVSHEHGSLLEGKFFRPLIDRGVVATLSTKILAVSEWDRRQIIKLERIPPERVDVLPNGIPPPPPPGPDPRASMGVPTGVPFIGAVGRVFAQKGYEDLIQAVAALRDAGRELCCVIVGDGREDLTRELQALIAALGVEQQVRMVGRREDVYDVIRAFDVAVLSSKWEGSPLALLEYMAVGAPIVATSVGGVPEMVQDGEHGLLVSANDPRSLATGIERLLDEPELARRLGAAARERQRANYDLDVVVARLEDMYVELYERAKHRRRR